VRARALERTYEPGALLARVNRTLRRRGVAGLFCTLAYAVFDLPGRVLTIANSGLPYPLHYRADLGRCEPLELPGVPLGAFDRASYEERRIALSPGDVFVFFTDGVIEASRDGEEYGIPRLVEQVERHAARSASDLADRIVSELDLFLAGAPPADDVTFVVVKIL
jgi:sigma-B regulation protein RsbU (phosphoserine phosphatase)